jgi:hypothetical protein
MSVMYKLFHENHLYCLDQGHHLLTILWLCTKELSINVAIISVLVVINTKRFTEDKKNIFVLVNMGTLTDLLKVQINFR